MLRSLSDTELINAYLSSGEQQYFAVLYNRYRLFVFRICMKVVNDEALAEDLTQDTFERVCLKLNRFHYRSQFSSWLYVLTRNRCISYLRTREKILLVPLEREAFLLADSDYCTDESQLILAAMLEQLSLPEQELLRFKYVDRLCIREISLQTGLSQSAIKMRLLRCRRKMITQLAKSAMRLVELRAGLF